MYKKHIYIIAIAIPVLLILGAVIVRGGHDLSGTYSTCDFFLISSIAFSEDGTFTAYNNYEVLEGKYKKRGNTYSLQFTDGKSNSGNPVSNFTASQTGDEYELKAEKINDGQLRVYVIPKIGGYAWYGKWADFYQYGAVYSTTDEAVTEAPVEAPDWTPDETSISYETGEGYSDEQLCEMALAYYVKYNNYTPEHVQVDMVEGDTVIIHLFDSIDGHLATCDWYYINRYTASGTNIMEEEIHLNE